MMLYCRGICKKKIGHHKTTDGRWQCNRCCYYSSEERKDVIRSEIGNSLRSGPYNTRKSSEDKEK